MVGPAWECQLGAGPVAAVALHDGHELRPEVRALLAIDEQQRRHEEDPYTGAWTTVAPTRVVVRRSRFEVDLNRPREAAVYRTPAEAWGLPVWRAPPPSELIARSLALYDAFYAELQELLGELVQAWGRVAVLDLHSYNHRRGGPDSVPADPVDNPQINLGTKSLDRRRWAPVVDRFVADLRAQQLDGGAVDVRENVRFGGGHLARWVHHTFAETACALAIEVKKTFMDEHRDVLDERRHREVHRVLEATVPGLAQELGR